MSPARQVVLLNDTASSMLSLEFTMPGAVTAAFAVSAGLPVCLFVIARLPPFAGRNAIQFLISVTIAIAAWVAALLLVPAVRPAGAPRSCRWGHGHRIRDARVSRDLEPVVARLHARPHRHDPPGRRPAHGSGAGQVLPGRGRIGR